MFAPPPSLPLSKAEVEARLAVVSRNAASVEQQEDKNSPGLRAERSAAGLRSPGRWTTRWTARQNAQLPVLLGNLLTSGPAATPPPSTPPPPTPRKSPGYFDYTSVAGLTSPAFEKPRKAPMPPKRPSRPPSELFLPPLPSPPNHGLASWRRLEHVHASPSALLGSERLSPSRGVAVRYAESTSPLMPRPLFSHGSLRARNRQTSSPGDSTMSSNSVLLQRPHELIEAVVGADIENARRRTPRGSGSSASSRSTTATPLAGDAIRTERSTTAPPNSNGADGSSSSQSERHGVLGDIETNLKHAEISSVRFLDESLNTVRKRSKEQSRTILLGMKDQRGIRRRVGSVAKSTTRKKIPGSQTTDRRRKRETMGMLLDSSNFFDEEGVNSKPKRYEKSVALTNLRIKPPPRLSFNESDLPSTPGSILSTPTEGYIRGTTSPRSRVRDHKSSESRRNPLSVVPEIYCMVKSRGLRKETEQLPPRKVAATSEYLATSENSPRISGMATPVATQIQTSRGSVVTVTPPEMHAWRPHVYIHGPIKLPTPAIMPRKNSIASLEAFRGVVDQMYEQALAVPRRRSADSDDFCNFFDDFGLDMGSWKGDQLRFLEIDVKQIGEAKAMGTESEYVSPVLAVQPASSPVEKVIAKEALETSGNAPTAWDFAMLPLVVPPVENEETIRAKGIGRLERLTRNPAGSGKTDASSFGKRAITPEKRESRVNLPLLPTPEDSMVHEGQTGEQGVDDDDIEEIDSASMSEWVAPTAPGKASEQGVSSGMTRKAVSKMRRPVAKASTAVET